MQQGEENEFEEEVRERIGQLIDGEEIGAEGIDSDDGDYDSDDGSIIMNFQFTQPAVKIFKPATEKVPKKLMRLFNMTSMEMKMRKRYTEKDILIDTGSTCSVVRNPNMLLNIKNSKNIMKTVSNGGYQDYKLRGMFPGFFRVWLNEHYFMNIMSMSDVTGHFRVTMDSKVDN